MDPYFEDKLEPDDSIPLPPGVDYDENRRHQKLDSRSKSRDYDYRERSRHDRESRFEREDYNKSHSDDHRRNRDSKDSANEFRDRDYRSHDRRSHRDRSRDRTKDRSRDRDFERSRDRGRDRSRERTRDRSRDRDRDRIRDRDRVYEENEMEYRDDIPNSTILIRGVPSHIIEDDIRTETSKYTLYPLEISVKRRKLTGESRGFALVEFRMLSDAVRWKELTNGVLYFGQSIATLHYYAARDNGLERTASIKVDWSCVKCGINNFRKRDVCFKCGGTREESELCSMDEEGLNEVSISPSSTLLFRNLDILTTEERVLSMLGQITVLPIKNLKVAKDALTNISRGFAYVELHSISEATQLLDEILAMAGKFYVDGRQVTVTYSRKALSSLNSTASANAASAALAAAQWTNQGVNYTQTNAKMFSDSEIQGQQMQSVQSINAGYGTAYQNNSTPDVSTYQYDETSGYYYDSTTGYYYDPNSQYYYNSKTQQYLYWDLEKQTYIVVPKTETSMPAVIQAAATTNTLSAEAVISSPPVIAAAPVLTTKKAETKEKTQVQDKVKIAKKVAKDMEKWAKTLNQKKENSKMGNNAFVPKPAAMESNFKSSDSSFAIVEKKLEPVQTYKGVEMASANGRLLFSSETKEKPAACLVEAYEGESDSDGENEIDEGTRASDFLKSEEAKLIDWDKLACLLCKRQFPTKEVLAKHINMSDLHKQNVNMLKLTKLTPKQLQELEKNESGYRDRAKERRQKFGQPDLPPPSRLKTKYLKEKREAFLPPNPPAEAIGSDNIGNKMLKAMGWSEGQGLGKTGQGMSGIIEVERRVKSAGLGMKGAAYGANASDSYKDAVRKSMQQRYNDIL